MAEATPRPHRREPGVETIWTRPDRGARGPQPQHSRDAIAAAGMALADSGGLAAVSMRAVAHALGTGAGTLYRYLTSRDDLVSLMVDAALAELPLDRQPSGNWLDDLVGVAHDQLALYRRHPWLLDTGPRPGPAGPRTIQLFEQYLRLLASVPCEVTTKLEATAMMTGVVSLFARNETIAQGPPTSPADLFATANRREHPHLIAARDRPAPRTPGPDLFDRTVRGLLTGLLVPSRDDLVEHLDAGGTGRLS